MLALLIPNMTCGGCARAISRAIQALDPQATVDADPRTKRATVRSTASRSAIVNVLIEAGYPPQHVAS